MFVAAVLVGLREGLEASLVIGILYAAVNRRSATQARTTVTLGVVRAALICTTLGAVLTFGRSTLLTAPPSRGE
ncbi:FTR1 family protein [Corynebacterium liangguodongii]|uniref:Uncharacterized protein n=1 Tax=Corynebacterium liangguodongii TaxID=2079535 RepID=A0A2S0WFT5_9CORY|nr:FTR1 family protein [Corynebacterium liangguodongii]AWB84542.1 hypothetical protein C3E79_08640 [Corynebacterium liangguodongii]PWB98874.1 hypothetical protein DF219_09745 [Corynebacterium liangguodongii]